MLQSTKKRDAQCNVANLLTTCFSRRNRTDDSSYRAPPDGDVGINALRIAWDRKFGAVNLLRKWSYLEEMPLFSSHTGSPRTE
ncbi:hypothetical protein GJAV_G00184160 [Gymnothorax javanicus]|nr:hypothetical protein GJAV_G00184160 [Gymnothorax javanicus]